MFRVVSFLKSLSWVLSCAFFSTTASAATIYSENVSGDLSAAPLTVLNLQVGSNEIYGSSTTFGGKDFDSFILNLNAGLQATLGDYEVLGSTLSQNLTKLTTHYILSDGGGNFGMSVDILSGGESLSGVLGAGSYTVWNDAITKLNGNGAWDYKITINVSAVPEPEQAALLLAGLAMLGATYRKRKAA